ncbi:ribosomal protein S5 domain 2-like protein, partial [Dacryopinax primogenitus]
SNIDRRRITGPDRSTPPSFPSSQYSKRTREPAAIRPIFLHTGLVPAASGSAYLESPPLKLVVSVYGPRQQKPSTSSASGVLPSLSSSAYSEKGTLSVSLKFAPFATRVRKAPLKETEDREISLRVRAALAPAVLLERYPKSSIDVYIHVLESDQGQGDALVCAAITAASAALAHAGVEMRGLVVGCAAARVGGVTYLDPEGETGETVKGGVGVGCLPALGSLTGIWQWGELSVEEV